MYVETKFSNQVQEEPSYKNVDIRHWFGLEESLPLLQFNYFALNSDLTVAYKI